MINGNSHRYLQHQINNISPKVLQRLTDRALKKPVAPEHRPPYTLPLANNEPEIFAPHVDVTRAKVAFGQWAIPKLRRELRNSDPLIVNQALCSLLDMAYDPEKAVQIISLNVIPWLVKLMRSDSVYVRKKTLQILRVMANQPGGKPAIIQISDLLHNISLMMSDTEDKIRLEAVSVLEELARGYKGVRCLVEANFVTVINESLEKETVHEVVIKLLTVLELLLDQNGNAKLECLDKNGCELAVFLEHLNPVIRANSAAVLAQLLVHPLGKQLVVQHRAGILQMLILCLDDKSEQVKINAAAALMFALTTTPAKNQCLILNIIPKLLHYTQASNCPELQRNSIKALTNMAETPDGRVMLLKFVDFLRKTDTRGNKDIKDHLEALINTILWLP